MSQWLGKIGWLDGEPVERRDSRLRPQLSVVPPVRAMRDYIGCSEGNVGYRLNEPRNF